MLAKKAPNVAESVAIGQPLIAQARREGWTIKQSFTAKKGGVVDLPSSATHLRSSNNNDQYPIGAFFVKAVDHERKDLLLSGYPSRNMEHNKKVSPTALPHWW